VLLLGFIERAPWLSRTQFRDYWWERHRPLANTLVPPALQPAAYVHDYALPDAPVEWDGCGELYEATLENARARAAWFDSAAAAPLAVDEARFLVRDTRRVVLTTHEILV
jgi:EthD domain